MAAAVAVVAVTRVATHVADLVAPDQKVPVGAPVLIKENRQGRRAVAVVTAADKSAIAGIDQFEFNL